MNPSRQTESASTGHLLTCLGLAIDQAKLVRSIIRLQDRAYKLKQKKSFSDQLIHLNLEIKHLETKLAHVRSWANRGNA